MSEFNYNKLSEYLKKKYGKRTLKICIDGGFTCPNRDGTKGVDGCIFCSQRGAGDHLNVKPIKEQVKDYFASYKAELVDSFIVYFQNYSNTYAKVDELKKKYDEALIDDRIKVLDIATRADCIDEDICKLLASYKEKGLDVWVELGLQTSNDKIGDLLNRKYTTCDVTNAVKLLNQYGLDCILHIMVGLPNEKEEDIINTVKYLNTLNYQGLKIHSTYVVDGTKLKELYKDGLYKPLELDYYLKQVGYILSNINPNVVIHKLTGDSPKELLLAPKWNLHKTKLMNEIHKYLKDNKIVQGMNYIV